MVASTNFTKNTSLPSSLLVSGLCFVVIVVIVVVLIVFFFVQMQYGSVVIVLRNTCSIPSYIHSFVYHDLLFWCLGFCCCCYSFSNGVGVFVCSFVRSFVVFDS